jgi:hypothetical protein
MWALGVARWSSPGLLRLLHVFRLAPPSAPHHWAGTRLSSAACSAWWLAYLLHRAWRCEIVAPIPRLKLRQCRLRKADGGSAEGAGSNSKRLMGPCAWGNERSWTWVIITSTAGNIALQLSAFSSRCWSVDTSGKPGQSLSRDHKGKHCVASMTGKWGTANVGAIGVYATFRHLLGVYLIAEWGGCWGIIGTGSMDLQRDFARREP